MSKASQIRQKAQELLAKGQIEKAIQEYRRLISVESKNPNLYNELGDIYLRAGDREQAVSNFEKASVIYEKVALYNNAVAVCKKILRVDPEKADALAKLAELRAKQKIESEATAFFNQFADSVLANPDIAKRSQEKIERMLELMPGNETILERSAEIYEKLGMKLKAAELLSKLMASASDRGDSKKQARHRSKLEQMRSELSPDESAKMKEFEDAQISPAARESSEQAVDSDRIEKEPKQEERYEFGKALAEHVVVEEGRSDESLQKETYDREATRDSEISETIEEAEMVAAMSRGLADIPFAPEREEKTVAADKSSSGKVLEPERGSSTDASMQTEKSQVRPVTSKEPCYESDEFGSNALIEGITSDVEKEDLKSHYDLGMAYLEMGLFNEAIRDFQTSSRCPELQVSSMEMIGYCFLKSNQPRLAVKQLERALDAAKRSGAETLGIHYNLGLAYEMLGEWAKAREHFEEVYIVDMSFRDVAEKIKKTSAVS